MKQHVIAMALAVLALTACSTPDDSSSASSARFEAEPSASQVPNTGTTTPTADALPSATPSPSGSTADPSPSPLPLDDDNVLMDASPGDDEEAAFLASLPEFDPKDFPEGYVDFVVDTAMRGECMALYGPIEENSAYDDPTSKAMADFAVDVLTTADQAGMCDTVESTDD